VIQSGVDSNEGLGRNIALALDAPAGSIAFASPKSNTFTCRLRS